MSDAVPESERVQTRYTLCYEAIHKKGEFFEKIEYRVSSNRILAGSKLVIITGGQLASREENESGCTTESPSVEH